MKPNDIAAARLRRIPPSFAGGGFLDPIRPSREFVVTHWPRAHHFGQALVLEAGQGAAPIAKPDRGVKQHYEYDASGPSRDKGQRVHSTSPRNVIAKRADHRARNGKASTDHDQQLAQARAERG